MKVAVPLMFVVVLAGGVVTGALADALATPSAAPSDPTPTTPPPNEAAAPAPTAAAPTPTAPAPAPTTAVTTTTTTLPPVPADVFNAACVRVVRPGDSYSLIADAVTPQVSTSALLAENSASADHVLHAGDLLDVCVGNDVNDINGASRLRPATVLLPGNDRNAIRTQQQKLNDLFGQYGMTPLAVDGISGPLTRQQLCAARVFLGLPISRSDMSAGGTEEAKLLAMTSVPIPPNAPTNGNRWVLLDMTCQVLIAGDGTSGVRFIFPTSTGEAGFETRVVLEADAFRFDPAVDNGGWHDSSEFPSAYDNPLNGNMYKPIYFHNGQAIHGANNVPPRPASKGCTRLSVANQDALVAWLGLAEAAGPVWRESTINLRVTTQGGYLPDP